MSLQQITLNFKVHTLRTLFFAKKVKFSSIVLEKMNGAKSGDFTKKAIVKGTRNRLCNLVIAVLLIIAVSDFPIPFSYVGC